MRMKIRKFIRIWRNNELFYDSFHKEIKIMLILLPISALLYVFRDVDQKFLDCSYLGENGWIFNLPLYIGCALLLFIKLRKVIKKRQKD